MKKPSLNSLKLELCLLLAFISQGVFALSTDKDQDIEIYADSAVLDELNNTSIYTGNVIVIQGSIYMTGDKMTVYNDDNDELEVLIMEGKPATHRQLPDNSTVYDKSRALTMEYYEKKNLIYLIEEAWSKQGDGEISGVCIEYDTELSRAKAWSGSVKCSNQTINVDKNDPDKPKERVKIIIRKKKAEEEKDPPEPAVDEPAVDEPAVDEPAVEQ